MATLVSSLLIFCLLSQSSCWGFRSPLSVFKRYNDNSRYLSNECLGSPKQPILSDSPEFSLDIRMPGVTPAESDTYFCMSYRLPVDDEAYVVDFKPHANMNTAHHMLLFGCNMPSSSEDYWDCDLGTCTDKSNILYAWAKNAPPTKLPEGVGFKVGGTSGNKYFVLQVHYGDVTAFKDNHKDCTGVTLQLTMEKQPMVAGIYLMMSVNTVIPPGEKVTNSDIACAYKRYPMYPFAYRVHTHHLGKVVSGYRIRDGEWTLIGRQSPQLPQAFYPVAHHLDVSSGDILAARCVFSGEGRKTETHIGGTSVDEMCNFYIMYYMDAAHATSYMTCVQDGRADLFRNIPEEANVPIPVDPSMMMSHEHHHHEAMKDPVTNSFALQQPKREQEEVLDQDFHLEEVIDWPGINLKLGQVSGLALDPKNNLVIFHRGDHVWDGNSFDRKFVYQMRGIGPIEQSTILVVDPTTSTVLQSTGKNMFYLPHGLTVDKDGNYWVTDVALHQVFKLGAQGGDSPLLVLGKAFQPGSDKSHFCQPTDVAVDPATGNFYVSDGYCNSRIMQFSPLGKFLLQWGEESSSPAAKAGQFSIPHSLALLPDLRQLCVADRENGRIQCFRLETGEFVKEIKHKAFGSEVFAVSYAPGGLLYAVNGMPYMTDTAPVQGFVMNFSNGEIIDTFLPVRKSFDMPHDVVASEDGTVYVGDAHAKTVWKFAPTESDSEHKLESSSGGLLGRLRGKGTGGLNLGNFFASHKGYSRKGFDRLSTEGSDQEKDEDDGTDSEEEYSAPPPPPLPPPAASSS
ncbi:peptidyl-glycine alpha-amidating monooxygenase isoform X4 [Lissotriton helveticus]